MCSARHLIYKSRNVSKISERCYRAAKSLAIAQGQNNSVAASSLRAGGWSKITQRLSLETGLKFRAASLHPAATASKRMRRARQASVPKRIVGRRTKSSRPTPSRMNERPRTANLQTSATPARKPRLGSGRAPRRAERSPKRTRPNEMRRSYLHSMPSGKVRSAKHRSCSFAARAISNIGSSAALTQN